MVEPSVEKKGNQKKNDIRVLKEQIQQVTKKKPQPVHGGRNVAAGNVKTQQNAGRPTTHEEDEYEEASDVIEEDERLQDEIDLDDIDQRHETEDSDVKDFADIKQSLRK